MDEHANANNIIELLKKYGPISVGVKVGDRFKEHKSGIIFKNWVLDDEAINHFVVLVGYGETWFDNKPY